MTNTNAPQSTQAAEARTAAILEAVNGRSAYSLANDAESACDNPEAVAFFEGIRDGYAEAVQYAGDVVPSDAQACDEIADGAPDIYNHTRMLELVGTRAYLDTPELATGNEDILTLAGYALYGIARLVIDSLVETATEYAAEHDAI